MFRPELLLVHEPVAACEARLRTEGYDAVAAGEIASYLAQSTDLATEFDALRDACARRDIAFVPVELDDAAEALHARQPGRALVWTLTDGIAYFRGGAAPALARLYDHRTVGADDSLFALCQDKFRSGAVLRRRLARAGAAIGARPFRQAEPARRQDRHLAGFPLRRHPSRRNAEPPRLHRLPRRRRRAALHAGSQCPRELSRG
jgi:hypothetical protein